MISAALRRIKPPALWLRSERLIFEGRAHPGGRSGYRQLTEPKLPRPWTRLARCEDGGFARCSQYLRGENSLHLDCQRQWPSPVVGFIFLFKHRPREEWQSSLFSALDFGSMIHIMLSPSHPDLVHLQHVTICNPSNLKSSQFNSPTASSIQELYSLKTSRLTVLIRFPVG